MLRIRVLLLFLVLCVAPGTYAAAPARATFAGGCFWCMEEPFEKIDGVISVTSGFTGGGPKGPSYKAVSSGGTGHVEAVQVLYDPSKVSYEQLLEIFWRNIDPTDEGGQFCDRGSQYRTGIFYHDETQKELAEKSRMAIEARLNHQVITPVVAATEFFKAEAYH